jgi:hypothetical protein
LQISLLQRRGRANHLNVIERDCDLAGKFQTQFRLRRIPADQQACKGQLFEWKNNQKPGVLRGSLDLCAAAKCRASALKCRLEIAA